MLLQLPSCTSQGKNKRGKLKAVSVATLHNWCFHLIQLKYQFSKDFYTCSSADSYYPWKPYGRPISTHSSIKLRILYGAEKKWIFFLYFLTMCFMLSWRSCNHFWLTRCLTCSSKMYQQPQNLVWLFIIMVGFSSCSLFWFIKPTALKYVH